MRKIASALPSSGPLSDDVRVWQTVANSELRRQYHQSHHRRKINGSSGLTATGKIE